MPTRFDPRLLLGLTPLLPLVGVLPGGSWLLPLVAPLTLWPVFSAAVRGRHYGSAFAFGVVWATLLSSGTILFTQLAPRTAGTAILNAEPYRQEMFSWIETGVGKENEPAEFLPEHLLHLGLFVLLTYATGGYLGLALGAALVGYMSYFVGSFAASTGAPIAAALAAWVPWSVVRVLAFVALGSVLARPLLVRERWGMGDREWRWMGWAAIGIAIDLACKSLFAPAYGRFLRELLERAA